jgi:hypothetical protein
MKHLIGMAVLIGLLISCGRSEIVLDRTQSTQNIELVNDDAIDLVGDMKQIQDLGAGLHLNSIDDPLPTPYNSNPPTSGWHVGNQIAPWGIHKIPLDDKITVHNLEHGGVIIHYKESLESDIVNELEMLVRELQVSNPCIIVMPRPDNDIPVPIVLTAWNYMLEVQSIDRDKIITFFNSRVGKGPEKICYSTNANP